jgi:hypothetical protein
MTAPMDCRLVGRWRIVEADLWDRGHLDLVGPAMMFEEGDEFTGSGSAELTDDGTLEIAFADEAILKAEPASSSTAC